MKANPNDNPENIAKLTAQFTLMYSGLYNNRDAVKSQELRGLAASVLPELVVIDKELNNLFCNDRRAIKIWTSKISDYLKLYRSLSSLYLVVDKTDSDLEEMLRIFSTLMAYRTVYLETLLLNISPGVSKTKGRKVRVSAKRK